MQLTLESFEAVQPRGKEHILLNNRTLPGAYTVTPKSEIANSPTPTAETFDPRQIPFSIQGDPNEDLWREVKEGRVGVGIYKFNNFVLIKLSYCHIEDDGAQKIAIVYNKITMRQCAFF